MGRNVRDILKLGVSIIVCEGAGAIGSIFTISAIPTWYAALKKPSFNPPNWLFGPVWTALYLMMGVSVFLIWRKRLGEPQKRNALIVFVIQLVLNVLWSLVFFGLKSPFYGFVVIIALWAAIVLTIFSFSRVSSAAACLLLPYILWVSFAAVLNFSIWRLNP